MPQKRDLPVAALALLLLPFPLSLLGLGGPSPTAVVASALASMGRTPPAGLTGPTSF